MLTGQLSLLGGARAEWPAELPDLVAPDAIAHWFADTLTTVPAIALTELDCDEFPCIAFFRYAEGEPRSSDVVAPVVSAFGAHTDHAGVPRVHVTGTEAGAFAAIAFGMGEPPERTQARMAQLAEAYVK